MRWIGSAHHETLSVTMGVNCPNRHNRRTHDAVICVYDDAGNMIETHEHKGDFKEP